jgi:hypothetical protein
MPASGNQRGVARDQDEIGPERQQVPQERIARVWRVGLRADQAGATTTGVSIMMSMGFSAHGANFFQNHSQLESLPGAEPADVVAHVALPAGDLVEALDLVHDEPG